MRVLDGRQVPQFEVAEPGFVLVIVQHDVPFNLQAEVGQLRELDLRDNGFDRLADEFVFEGLLALEPVLEVLPLARTAIGGRRRRL